MEGLDILEYSGGGYSRIVIVGSVNFESGSGFLPEVSRLVAGVHDPGNRFRGTLVWHQPWGDGKFPVEGAKNFSVTRFGTPEKKQGK